MSAPRPGRSHALVPALVAGSAPAPSPAQADGPVARWDANDGHVLHGFRAAGTGWVALEGVAAYGFGPSGPVTVVPADGGPPTEELEDAWVRSALPLVLQARGTQVLHAAALRGAAGAVALCGASTDGKSTLAAALLRRGRAVLADDALALDESDALTLPFRLRLRAPTQEALGLPPVAATGAGGERLPLAAVVLLTPDDEDEPAALEALSASTAFAELMPHAYCFALEEGKEALVAAYLDLVQRVPVHRLCYPQRLDRLDATADVLDALLAR